MIRVASLVAFVAIAGLVVVGVAIAVVLMLLHLPDDRR